MKNWKFMNFVNLRKLYILLTSLIIVTKVERNNKFWWNKPLKPYFKKLCRAETFTCLKNAKYLTKCDVCWPLEQLRPAFGANRSERGRRLSITCKKPNNGKSNQANQSFFPVFPQQRRIYFLTGLKLSKKFDWKTLKKA